MKISLLPEITDAEKIARKESLLTILRADKLAASVRLPRGTVCIDGNYYIFEYGHWQKSGYSLFLPRHADFTAAEGGLDHIARLGVLSVTAIAFGLDNDPDIQEAIAKAFEVGIKEGRSEAHTLILSKITPSQLACAPDMSQFAAKLDGKWYSPTGVEVEVTPAWIVMDC